MKIKWQLEDLASIHYWNGSTWTEDDHFYGIIPDWDETIMPMPRITKWSWLSDDPDCGLSYGGRVWCQDAASDPEY